MLFIRLFILLLFFSTHCVAIEEITDLQKLKSFLSTPVPKWIKKRISKDLNDYKDHKFSIKELNERFYQEDASSLLVKYTIRDNQVFVEENIPECYRYHRSPSITQSLMDLCSIVPMPNVTFFVCMHDGIYPDCSLSFDFPLFVMSKHGDSKMPGILFPDFEVLNQKYQVIPEKKVEEYKIPWSEKKPVLVWRGSTAQYPGGLNSANLHLFSRVALCRFSSQFPDLIDAKFTMFFLGADQISELHQYKGSWISFSEQFDYKYHILIDGLAAAFSNSGWKFFSNSVILKPKSPWIQWYSDELIPYKHFVPLNSDLSDLLAKLGKLKESDKVAEKLAANARKFAKTHILYQYNMLYMYELVKEYSKLNIK